MALNRTDNQELEIFENNEYKVQNIISEIEHIFGRQPKEYIIKLINDSLIEIGSSRQSNTLYSKRDLIEDQRWYELLSNVIDIQRIEIKDTNGRYVMIPKLSDAHKLLKEDEL